MILSELLAEIEQALDRLAHVDPTMRSTVGSLRFRASCARAAIEAFDSERAAGTPARGPKPARGSADESAASAAPAPGAEPPLSSSALAAALLFECQTNDQDGVPMWARGCGRVFHLAEARGVPNGHGRVRCPGCNSIRLAVGIRSLGSTSSSRPAFDREAL